MKKRRIILRVFPFNRLTFPTLLNSWESEKIDEYFEIKISENPVQCEDGDVILFSFMTPHLPLIDKEVQRLKKKKVLIVGGGAHITGDTWLPSKIGFNILFRGEGEETFKQFGRDLLSGDISPGLKIYQQEKKTDPDNYLPFSKYFKTVPPLEIFRGCFWRCKYCQTGSKDQSVRSLNSIKSYLAGLKDGGFKRVTFISPSSLEYGAAHGGKPESGKIIELMDSVKSFDFKFFEYGIFPSEIRPGTLSADIAGILKKNVSNKWITLGAQSGSDHRLKELNRGHNTEDIETDIETANLAGFKVSLDFILGYPDETTDERDETFRFINKLSKKYRIRVHLHHFFPLPGSNYQFRFPSFLNTKEKVYLRRLWKNGISTDWWEQHEFLAKGYFKWLQKTYPEYLNKYR